MNRLLAATFVLALSPLAVPASAAVYTFDESVLGDLHEYESGVTLQPGDSIVLIGSCPTPATTTACATSSASAPLSTCSA